MKRKLLNIANIIVTVLLVISCANKSYTIHGTVDSNEDMNGETVYLVNQNTDTKIDSTTIVNGNFTFTRSFDTASILSISIDNSSFYGTALTESMDVEIELKNRGGFATSDGLNGVLNKMEQEIKDINHSIVQKNESLSLNSLYMGQHKMNEKEKEEYVNIFSLFKSYQDSLRLVMANSQNKILEDNSDNILGVYCVTKILQRTASKTMTIEQVDSLLSTVSSWRQSGYLVALRNEIASKEATSAGRPFVDFEAESVSGDAVKLSNYVGKGKYVLLDFTASWCGPCKMEIPNLKYLHNKYPELVILGVSVWDSRENFLKSIQTDDIPWVMIYAKNIPPITMSNFNQGSGATGKYGVRGIPTIILFSPDGTIVDRTLRGERMKKKIAEIYN